MIDLGTVRPGSTIRVPFSSFDKDDGSSITMTNFAAGDILIYKDGNTTARASTAGFTATTDFSSKTGKHLAIIDLADNTTAGFFNAGSEYLVAIDAVTVDAVTTGGWVARFRIGYDGANLETTIASLSSQTSFTLTTGPAEDDALNGCVVAIHDIASAVQMGYAVVSDYTGSTKTVTLTAGVTFTAATGDNISFFPPGNARWFAALLTAKIPLAPATAGRDLVVDAAGLADANTVKIGPTGSGTAQTARDIGASVLLSSGTGTGQVTLTSGRVNADITHISASAVTATGGRMEVNTTHWAGTAVGSTEVRANLINIAGAAVSTTTAQLGVNAVQISGDGAAADNLETAFDDTAGSVKWLGIIDQGTAQAATSTTLQLRSAAAFADDELIGATIQITGGTTGVGQARVITDYVSSTDTATVDAWTTTPTGTITYKIYGTAPASASSAPTAAQIADAVWEEAIGDHSGTSGSTAEQLAAAGAAGDPWATALPGAYSSGQAGKIVGDNLNATVSSRLASASYTAPLDAAGTRTAVGLASANLDTQLDGLPTAAENATAVWASGTRVLTAGTNIALAKGTGVTGFNDLDAAGVRTAVGLASANLDTQLGDLPTAGENADAVWDEAIAGHLSAGSTGQALNSAGAAGDPWVATLPGSYTGQQAGAIIGALTFTDNNVNANIEMVIGDQIQENGSSSTNWGKA